MARQARQKSSIGLYHIIFRGISRQNIFEEPKDYEKMLEIIIKVKKELKYKIYAYCLMSNHVHLFIKENNEGEISKIMHKILTCYARWYNIKYLRTGILFENRYKSEPIEDDRYFIGLIRYIHQNPLKAGIIEKLEDYEWSSYREYIKIKNNDITNVNFALEMLSENRKNAIELFKEMSNTIEFEIYEINSTYKKSNEYIRRLIMTKINGKEPHIIKNMPKKERDEIIVKLLEEGISKSALERATGISRGTIARIAQKVTRP